MGILVWYFLELFSPIMMNFYDRYSMLKILNRLKLKVGDA
jgi:hypothetical protein